MVCKRWVQNVHGYTPGSFMLAQQAIGQQDLLPKRYVEKMCLNIKPCSGETGGTYISRPTVRLLRGMMLNLENKASIPSSFLNGNNSLSH